MTYETVEAWLKVEENRKLFKPYNAKPNQQQLREIFEVAAFLDPKGNHKLSGCGRCVYNALRAIERHLNIF